MYREIIEVKQEISDDTFHKLKSICILAHKNRSGSVEIKELSERKFFFEGSEKEYGCLQLGYLSLYEQPFFRENIQSWEWEDEDPDESCNLLMELSASA